MKVATEGWWLILTLVLIAVLAHEPWRWLGYLVGRSLNPEDEIFKWVKAVSTALVSALVARLVLFPAGALAGTPLWLRLLSFALALAVFYRTDRTAWKGVLAGALLLAGGHLVFG